MTNQTPESVIAEAMVNAGAPLMHSRVEEGVASALRAANMLREPGVPDAATEQAKQELAACLDLRAYWRGQSVKARSERDAALAAIERVRALETFSITDSYPAWTAVDHDDLLAALEGAPEPEALELPETGLEVRDGDGDLITTGEHRRVLHQGGYVCDTCVNILGINVRWDRADRMEGHPLPAEGERK